MVRPGGIEALHGFGRVGRSRGIGRLIAVLAPGSRAFVALSALGLGAVVLASSSPRAPHAHWPDETQTADFRRGAAVQEPRWPETLTLDYAGSDGAAPTSMYGRLRFVRLRVQKALEQIAELTDSGGGAPFLPRGSGPQGPGPPERALDVDPFGQSGTGDAPGQPSFGEPGGFGQSSGPGGSMFDAGAPGGGGAPPSDGGGERTSGGSGAPPFGPPTGPGHFQPPPIGSGDPAPPLGPTSHIGLGTNPGSPTGPRGAIDCPLAISCLGDGGQGDFPVGDLAPIPEPGEWILLIGGFAMLGARMRGLRRLRLAVPGAR